MSSTSLTAIALSLYGRYVQIPDADPAEPGSSNEGQRTQRTSERFRSDHLYEYLDADPAPRRGLALAYSTPLFSAVLDHEGKHHPSLDESERDIGIQLTAPPIKILGPVHLNLGGWAEELRHDGPVQQSNGETWREAEVQRFTAEPSLSLTTWRGGLGFDAEIGLQGPRTPR